MAKISDLSGDERAQRIAELKKKMQARAEEVKSQYEAGEHPAQAAATPAAAEASAPVAGDTATESAADAVAVAESETPSAEPAEATEAEITETEAAPVPTNGSGTNGASAATASARPKPAPMPAPTKPPEPTKADMTRREFLTYAWGATMGLLALQAGVVSFRFMYPRFRAGEFGGLFFSNAFYGDQLPPEDAAPVAVADGKFWWVNVEGEGPRAIYMVCTHLGCLYKWVGERNQFECPCHGSKFTREGLYIEGPAPRSLDEFVTEQTEDGNWAVDTGAKILGASAAESPAAGTG